MTPEDRREQLMQHLDRLFCSGIRAQYPYLFHAMCFMPSAVVYSLVGCDAVWCGNQS
jgi:hypothetical protein